MNSGKVLGVAVAGIATGALAGILFAPAKGRKTRKRLFTKGKNYSGVLKEKFNKFEKVMEDVYFDDKKIDHPEEEVLQEAQII